MISLQKELKINWIILDGVLYIEESHPDSVAADEILCDLQRLGYPVKDYKLVKNFSELPFSSKDEEIQRLLGRHK